MVSGSRSAGTQQGEAEALGFSVLYKLRSCGGTDTRLELRASVRSRVGESYRAVRGVRAPQVRTRPRAVVSIVAAGLVDPLPVQIAPEVDVKAANAAALLGVSAAQRRRERSALGRGGVPERERLRTRSSSLCPALACGGARSERPAGGAGSS